MVVCSENVMSTIAIHSTCIGTIEISIYFRLFQVVQSFSAAVQSSVVQITIKFISVCSDCVEITIYFRVARQRSWSSKYFGIYSVTRVLVKTCSIVSNCVIRVILISPNWVQSQLVGIIGTQLYFKYFLFLTLRTSLTWSQSKLHLPLTNHTRPIWLNCFLYLDNTIHSVLIYYLLSSPWQLGLTRLW